MAGIGLTFPYNGNPPIFGVGYEVPNTKYPSVAIFSIIPSQYKEAPQSFDFPMVFQCTIPTAGISGAGLDFVKSVYIDNSQNDIPIKIIAKDTQYGIVCRGLRTGWFPMMTKQFNFDVILLETGTVYGDNTTIQIIFSNTVVPGNDTDESANIAEIVNAIDGTNVLIDTYGKDNYDALIQISGNIQNLTNQNSADFGLVNQNLVSFQTDNNTNLTNFQNANHIDLQNILNSVKGVPPNIQLFTQNVSSIIAPSDGATLVTYPIPFLTIPANSGAGITDINVSMTLAATGTEPRAITLYINDQFGFNYITAGFHPDGFPKEDPYHGSNVYGSINPIIDMHNLFIRSNNPTVDTNLSLAAIYGAGDTSSLTFQANIWAAMRTY